MMPEKAPMAACVEALSGIAAAQRRLAIGMRARQAPLRAPLGRHAHAAHGFGGCAPASASSAAQQRNAPRHRLEAVRYTAQPHAPYSALCSLLRNEASVEPLCKSARTMPRTAAASRS